jgi:Na+-translocating ferredoxin:NAD+ oxidoreductase subunit C
VHPPERKSYTESVPIRRMPFPDEIVLPLRQHAGRPAVPLVKPGERVERSDKVGEADGFISVPIHSSAAGRVRDITLWPHPDGSMAESVVIEVDRWSPQLPRPRIVARWEGLEPEQVVREVQKAGVVGLGGAAFPTHVKLLPPKDISVHTLIVNGAECEPYLTNDHRVMVERPEALLRGIEILATLLEAEETVIGIELNKPEAIATLNAHISPDQPIRVAPLRVKYPQGDSKMMIKSLLGIEVPAGLRSADLGIIMNNVSTIAAIADWFETGKPFIDRMVTVSGPGITKPSNLIVPIGTPVREVLRLCGGLTDDTREVIMGGPMMGTPVADLDAPVVKTSSGILAFTHEQTSRPKEYPCIRCGRCIEACPYFLNPSRLARLARARMYDEMKALNVTECVECGSCTYSCPSGIPIVQLIRTAKNDLRGRRRSSAH